MSELIDRQALLDKFATLKESAPTLKDVIYLDGVMAVIDSAPPIDAVQVVRCGECQYFNTDECAMVGTCDGCDCQVDLAFNSTGYCAKGKRRESEAE